MLCGAQRAPKPVSVAPIPAAMPTSRVAAAALAAALLCVQGALADVYMHNPRGSNDRNCERNVNRNNGNRLFDSQNNAKGGYACPRAVGGPDIITGKMYYYAGSKLPIEWTAQHGCGTNPKERCEVILQYACEDTLDPDNKFRSGANPGAPRDGTPVDANDAATDTIPATVDAATADTTDTRRYGMHENIDFYNDCRTRRRNTGLFTADQRLRRRDARATRQNPNGNRNGLECPEERDYYPYWHPTPWRDIAVLTSHQQRCPFFTANSQNVRAYGMCVAKAGSTEATQLKQQGRWYNNKKECEENGHTWEELPFGNKKFASAKAAPPVCIQGQFGRINHLGNALDSSYDPNTKAADQVAIPHADNANRFVWNVPDTVNENCVLRIRYNISTADYNAWELDGTPGLNATVNGKDKSPITQDPYIPIGTEIDEFVSLAVNTNQYGRTFQDRSYVFGIKADPRTAAQKTAGVTVYNLNVRGKRGNIVQTYPAVEYDFVPNDLNVKKGDMVHFQWTGSDYNPRRGCNNGEGGPPDPNTASAANKNSRADRSNLIEMTAMDMNMPRDITTAAKLAGGTMFVDEKGNPDMATVKKMAFLNQKETLQAIGRRCLTEEELEAIGNKNQRENHPQNCAKINAAFTPYFDAGLVSMNKDGAFTYFSSRNNNFSNRDQTGRLCVGTVCGPADNKGARGIDNKDARVIDNKVVAADDEDILEAETVAINEKDNDGMGDGEANDCEEMAWAFDGISSGAAVFLAFAMFGVGIIATVGLQKGVEHYRMKHGLRPDEPLNCFSKGKGGAGKPDHSRLKDTPTGGKRAPPPPPPSRGGGADTGIAMSSGTGKRAPPPPPPGRRGV